MHKRILISVISMFCVTSVFPQISIDPAIELGKIKPMNAINNGPEPDKGYLLDIKKAGIPAAADYMIEPVLCDTKISGAVGDKMDRFFARRIFSDFAKDTVFVEAENAFRTKVDDVMKAPVGYWQGEFWGKLMMSASRVAQYSGDPDLMRFIQEEAHRLIAFQDADGYLGTYRDKTFVCSHDPEDAIPVVGWSCDWCWNLWCRKYTMWGLLLCYQVTGDESLLDAVVKSMDQEIEMLKDLGLKVSQTGTAHFFGLPSCSVLKPLLQLYRITGYDRYLAFAREIVADWDCDDRHAPSLIKNAFMEVPVHEWYPDPNSWAKAYEMMSCLDGLLEYYRITGETRILEAVKAIQKNIWETERNQMWSVGYNDQFSGGAIHTNGTSEPCDAIHWIRLNHDLFLITGDPQYVDVMEMTFFNAFLAGVFRNGEWGARAVRSEGRHVVTSGQAFMNYSHCCVDNMPRCFMDIAQTLVTKGKDGAVHVNWYSDCSATIDGVHVEISGNYPVGDKVVVKVHSDKSETIRFRIPSWSRKTLVNGKKVPQGAWYEVSVSGDRSFTIQFDMTAKVLDCDRPSTVLAGNNDFRYVRWISGEKDLAPLFRTEPCAQIVRGPIILAKSVFVGDTQEQIYVDSTINHRGVKIVSLKPKENRNVWGAWDLVLSDGTKVAVCDYSSAGDCEFPAGECNFSIFF